MILLSSLLPSYTHIIKPNLKYIYLSFDQNGELVIKSPKVTQKEIEKVLIKKAAWITKSRQRLLEKKGKVHFHGINYIPGKPFCFGEVKGKPVFCLPGYPGAAAGVLHEFMKVASYHIALYNDTKEKIEAFSAFKIFSKLGMREFLKVKVGKISNDYFFYSLKRGSSVLTPFVEKDGILEIEEEYEGINKRERKEITLFTKKENIEKSIMFVGSNDFLISEIRDILRKKDYTKDLSIINTGSFGGLMAIKNKITHFAGIHLLDEETGEYNTSFIEKYLKKGEYIRIPFLLREQGLLVEKGNKKNITKIEDIANSDATFINRQRGSGTRILLDYLLKIILAFFIYQVISAFRKYMK